MNSILNLEENVVFGLQTLAFGALKYLWMFISFLANPAVFIIIFATVYWNINKREGIRFAYNTAFTLTIVNTLKSIFSIMRPFQYSSRIENLDLKGSASGTSFPSGHSALSASMYTSLYLSFPSVFKLLMLIILPLLVGVSRMALGVHYPADVIVGWGIGYAFTFTLYRLLSKMDEGLKKSIPLTVSLSSVLFVASLVLNILIVTKTLSHTRFADLASMFALLSGLMLGRFFEHHFVKYIVRARRAKKILRGILGLLPIVLLFAIFSRFNVVVSSTLLYFFISIWCTFLYPLIGIHTNLFNIR